MRRLLLLAAVTLAACSPPSGSTTATTSSTETATVTTPVQIACNALAPDITKTVRLTHPPVAVAALPDLAGGPIEPGRYDLTSGNALDGAPEWTDARAVTLEVSEDHAVVTMNWAATTPGADIERWTATFHQGPPAQLSFSCGRSGDISVHGAATHTELRLRMPDPGGAGSDAFVFTRRG